jgi:hypothetical protein
MERVEREIPEQVPGAGYRQYLNDQAHGEREDSYMSPANSASIWERTGNAGGNAVSVTCHNSFRPHFLVSSSCLPGGVKFKLIRNLTVH